MPLPDPGPPLDPRRLIAVVTGDFHGTPVMGNPIALELAEDEPVWVLEACGSRVSLPVGVSGEALLVAVVAALRDRVVDAWGTPWPSRLVDERPRVLEPFVAADGTAVWGDASTRTAACPVGALSSLPGTP